MKGISLNGWQRLWVLACLGMALAVAMFAAERITTEDEVTSWHEAKTSYFERKIKEARAGVKPSPMNIYLGTDESAEELLRQQAAENKSYASTIEHLPAEQLKKLSAFALAWAVGCVILYVLGWLVAWTIRGFRPNEKAGS
jgi:hypothetical protein